VHDNIRRAHQRHSFWHPSPLLYGDYSRLKTRLENESDLSWSVDLSALPQWGQPDGGPAAVQFLATSAIDWNLLKGKTFGEGSLQVLYITASYPGAPNADATTRRLGMITPINDYPFNQNIFAQLSYTQSFPGNKILVTIGQYPFFNFDSNQYLTNQQINFNSTIFSQNGTATYSNAGLGAYSQINLSDALQFAAGLQSANNIPGAGIRFNNFASGGLAWFGYGQWTPYFKGLGTAQYSVMFYQVPTVPAQAASRGWSINAVQNLNATWALFARANQANDTLTPIRRSFAVGATMTNPLGRSPTDQIGLAIGTSSPAPPPVNPTGAREEKVLEAYWSWTLLGGWLLTPSVQYVRDPALSPHRDSAWVLSVRATLML
jgi:carbohydrate-selective porin OprB